MRKLLISALVAVTLPAAAGAVTIANGSFENGIDPGSFTTLGAGSNGITDWTVLGGSVDYIGSYWQASDGVRSVDLSGNAIGTLGQVVTGLTAGQSYTVTFDVSRNPDGGVTPRTGVFTAGGQTFNFSYSDATSNRANMKWETVSYSFLATGSSALISFASDSSGGCCFGPALDNVRIAAVPEPASWAMMIGGFALLGAAARRRRSNAVFA
ncbi:choice-of-anchor C family PEP-CTERM protein [Sphingomonas sp.]|jgi:choice-of-anchor C domain-containing protein|uniref:choice-of-anchor C family PEP-CTERM protein n=1 Tax=Sphingomonas sp. TaxID=28214 RepID=UPI002DE35B21|nr:choice-of-anchor C family protein [Sphingomonas sp.]